MLKLWDIILYNIYTAALVCITRNNGPLDCFIRVFSNILSCKVIRIIMLINRIIQMAFTFIIILALQTWSNV